MREGYAADVAVFDPTVIAAKGDLPVCPVGIKHVFLNGNHIVKNGVADDKILLGSGNILQMR